MKDEEIWLVLYQALLAGEHVKEVAEVADKALLEYKERYPADGIEE